jgi:hypothetical protein
MKLGRLVEATVVFPFYLDAEIEETATSVQKEFDADPLLMAHAMQDTGEYKVTVRYVDEPVLKDTE